MTPSLRILVLHGPNLNLVGIREPDLYGKESLAEIDASLRTLARELGCQLEIAQSNHEGVLIDRIHEARTTKDALVINPGAFAHTSLALADAVRSVALPAVEVHLSNLFRRDPARQHSHLAEVVRGVVTGFGSEGYRLGLRAAVSFVKEQKP
jgi:3-dehydroquinate dehydratase-2